MNIKVKKSYSLESSSLINFQGLQLIDREADSHENNYEFELYEVRK